MCLNIDVLGIFRFVCVPPQNATVKMLCGQICREFQEMYNLRVPIAIKSLSRARQPHIALAQDALLIDATVDGDTINVKTTEEFEHIICAEPWKALGIKQEDFDARATLLADFFGASRTDTVRSCLLRAGVAADVPPDQELVQSLEGASAVASYIAPEVLGSRARLSFFAE